MTACATRLVERFPERWSAITRLVKNDQTFRTLADDYETAVNALKYWSEAKQPQSPIRCDEFGRLVADLEREITEFLRASQEG